MSMDGNTVTLLKVLHPECQVLNPLFPALSHC